MRIRTIKPEFWTDSFMVSVPHFGRLMFLSLINIADDHGFMRDDADGIGMLGMPREPVLVVSEWIDFFIATDRLERWVGEDEKTYLRIRNWTKHQKVDKPSNSRIHHESSRKFARSSGGVSTFLEARRAVARKYSCVSGGRISAKCYHCGKEGAIAWHNGISGFGAGIVAFGGLEIDPVMVGPKFADSTSENLVLSCPGCVPNRGSKDWFDGISSILLAKSIESYPTTRELSLEDQGSGFRDHLPCENKATASPSRGVGLKKEEKQPAAAVIKKPVSVAKSGEDPLFECMAKVIGANPSELTKAAATKIRLALLAIREVCPDLSENELALRAEKYRQKMPNAQITAIALRDHWARLGSSPVPKVKAEEQPAIAEPMGWKDHVNHFMAGSSYAENGEHEDKKWPQLPIAVQRHIVASMEKHGEKGAAA